MPRERSRYKFPFVVGQTLDRALIRVQNSYRKAVFRQVPRE